ncbi:MAG: hypothetical protein Q9207_005361 [Kuettlingeria erythrocarpa]
MTTVPRALSGRTDHARLVEKKLKGVQHIIKEYCQHIHSLRHGASEYSSIRQKNLRADRLQSKPGQGGDADTQPRDLRAQLLEAEAAHFSKTNGASHRPASISEPTTSSKRHLEAGPGQDGDVDEDIEAKRRRVLEESRDIDADSDDSSSSSSDEDRYYY